MDPKAADSGTPFPPVPEHGQTGPPHVDAKVTSPEDALPEDALEEPAESTSAEEPIRQGSPFAVDPLETPPEGPLENLYDVGPIRYTAMGAVAASAMVIFFGLAATRWFPAGGSLIASLGCLLSLFGLYSPYRITSIGLLAIHMTLFLLCYSRSMA